ncbi:hypothetical protein Tco_1475425 [Tanacetum coccineum]
MRPILSLLLGNEVERLLALTTPPPSPLTPLSSPLPHIPSPPFPVAPPASPICSVGLSGTDRPEITLLPRKRLGIDLGPRYEIGESSAAATTRPIRGRRANYGFVGTMDTEIRRRRAEEVDYGIRDIWIDPREAVEEVAPMTLGGINTRVTELTTVQEQDTQDIYAVIEDTQDRQTQIYQSVGILVNDSQYHYETARLLDQEALVSREAWGRSIEVSYMTPLEIMALRSVVRGQQAVISQLLAADHSDAPPPMPTSAPTSLPPLLLPSASHREDRPEVNLPPRKRLGIALGPGYEVGESSAAAAARPAGGLRADYSFIATMDREIRRDPERYVGYGITDSWDEIVETLHGAPVSTDTKLGAHVRDFESMVRRDTNEIYTMLDDKQSQRQLLASRVNLLFRDRRGHAHTQVMSLCTTVHTQMSEITELQSADRSRRRQQIIQTLTVMQTLQREMIPSSGNWSTTLQGQVDSFTGLDGITGAGCCIYRTAGTRGGPAHASSLEDGLSST